MKNALKLIAAAIFILSFNAQPASAGPGVRLGLTDDVDTLFGGLQWRVPIAKSGKGSFIVQPGVDLGLGLDDPINFMIRGTAHFGYLFPVSEDVSLYPLLGPTLVLYNRDDQNGSDNNTELGVDIGLGVQFQQFALELWLALSDDIPDVTVAVSFNL